MARQVWFVSLHCLHHWTVVRLIAGELVCSHMSKWHKISTLLQGVLLSEDFGFAPSTLLRT